MATLRKNFVGQLLWASLIALGATAFGQGCSSDSDDGTSNTGGDDRGGMGGGDTDPGSSGGANGGSTHAGSTNGGSTNGGTLPSQAGAPGSSGAGAGGQGPLTGDAGAPTAGGAGGALGAGGAGGQGPLDCPDKPLLIAQDEKASALAVQGGYVYWTTRALSGKVMRAPSGGGASETLSSGEVYPHQIAVGGEHVYWSTLSSAQGQLYQASLSGAERKQLATGETTAIYSLQADENNAYYATNLNVLYKMPAEGGQPQQLSGGPFNSTITDVVLDGTTLFWANNGVNTFVPVEPETASIRSVDVSGATSAAALETLLEYPQFEIATDATSLYWSDESAIYKAGKLGGAFSTVTTLPAAPADESPIVDLVSDGENLFYSDGSAVFRVSVLGGAPEVVADGWKRIVKLAVDEGGVYFTDYVLGAVVKLPKCASAVGPEQFGDVLGSGTTSLPADTGSGGAGDESTCEVATSQHGCPEPTVATTAVHAYGLASDDSYLYFSTLDAAGNIMRLPLAGGAAEPIASAEPYPHDIAVDAERVIWCLNDSPTGHLAMAPKVGGARQALTPGVGTAGLGRVTSDGRFAYYITAFSSIYRVALDGGKPGLIAMGPYASNAYDITVHQGELFWVNDGIWNANYTGKLPGTAYFGRAPVTGSGNLGHVSIKSGMDTPQYRTVSDGNFVYFVNKLSVFRADPRGGAPVELGAVPATVGTIRDMLSDGRDVYFADDQAVYRVPVLGGNVERVTFGWTALRSLATDAANLYFTDYSVGVVMKQSK